MKPLYKNSFGKTLKFVHSGACKIMKYEKKNHLDNYLPKFGKKLQLFFYLHELQNYLNTKASNTNLNGYTI